MTEASAKRLRSRARGPRAPCRPRGRRPRRRWERASSRSTPGSARTCVTSLSALRAGAASRGPACARTRARRTAARASADALRSTWRDAPSRGTSPGASPCTARAYPRRRASGSVATLKTYPIAPCGLPGAPDAVVDGPGDERRQRVRPVRMVDDEGREVPVGIGEPARVRWAGTRRASRWTMSAPKTESIITWRRRSTSSASSGTARRTRLMIRNGSHRDPGDVIGIFIGFRLLGVHSKVLAWWS